MVGSDFNGSASDIRAEPFTAATAAAGATPSGFGRVLDRAVAGASVFADANGNGTLDAGEASATTDGHGRYTFSAPASGPLVALGGTDISTACRSRPS